MCKLRVQVAIALLVLRISVRSVNEKDFNVGCSKTFTIENVVIESPGYPGGYPPESNCLYLFKGSDCPTYFNLQLLDFNLVSSPGCVTNRLEIDNQVLCGSISGIKSYYSSNGTLRVQFISDANPSGRGFKIAVTRLNCGVKPEFTTPEYDLAKVPNVISSVVTPKNVPGIPQQPPSCCENAYRNRHFFLISPGFPRSSAKPGECVYHIYRANPNICRLRMHFRFFWSGQQDENLGCNKGFLQVDGKSICGCHTGLKLISAFDSRWGSSPKTLRFRNSGFPQAAFSGFALEVVQDECPKRTASSPQPQFYNDQINRNASPLRNRNQSVIERALLLRESTEISDNGRAGVKRVYFFGAEEDYDSGPGAGSSEFEQRDVEQTTYVDTLGMKAVFTDRFDDYRCRSWGDAQWAMLAQEALWQQASRCSVNTPISRQCEQAHFVRGFVQSPGYPHYYPGNVNQCYRFVRHPGYCGIRLNFTDFQLDNSFDCQKDYLVLGGKYKYCGQSLHQAVLTFDLRNNPYEEIYFISSSHLCNRGFKGVYEQIPCDNLEIPGRPPNPVYPEKPTTPQPPPPVLPPHPQTPCSRDVREDPFVIEVQGAGQQQCVFNVHRISPRVCRLSLTFLSFNLPCGSEQLWINNRRYCGQISGQTLHVNFNNLYRLPIIYERTTPNPTLSGLRFRLTGRQISDRCDPSELPSVPAERRLINFEPANYNHELSDSDICGIILNGTEDAAVATICNALSASSCVRIKEKMTYIPFHSAGNNSLDGLKKGLNLTESDRLESLDVHEISCSDLNNIR